MPRILVPPEVLIRVSEEAARAAEELETTKNRLDQQITYMMSSWEGTTRSRFFEDFQHAHGEMNKTIEHLRIIGQELKTIAFRFISADMHEDLMLAAAAASAANEPKTFWDHAGDFWQGLQTGAKTVANSVKDTATSLVEDPLDTAKDMAYNMTIGAVEEVVDTAVWGGKMIFDADTQEKFAADVEASGGAFNFAGQQAAMTIAGLVGRRFGVKTHPHLKHDSGGDGGKVEGTPRSATSSGDLSQNLVDHILNRHSVNSTKNQLPFLQKKMSDDQINEMLSKKSFFNKEWSDNKIAEASTLAVNQLKQQGVTDGLHTVTVFGEPIKVFIRNGNVDSVYGTNMYKLSDLLD